MSVVVPQYHCGFANRLGEYFWPRIVASELEYRFVAPPLLNLETDIPGRDYHDPVQYVNNLGDGVVQEDEVFGRSDHRKIVMEGFFQQANKYAGYRDIIREWTASSLVPIRGLEDTTAIHIRLGDYAIHGWVLPVSYYVYAMKLTLPENCIVFSDEISPILDKYLEALAPYCPNIIAVDRNNFLESFQRMMGCGSIICGNSSFSWWAAFLSRAIRVWMPHNWGPWGRAQEGDRVYSKGMTYPTDFRYDGPGWKTIDMENLK